MEATPIVVLRFLPGGQFAFSHTRVLIFFHIRFFYIKLKTSEPFDSDESSVGFVGRDGA